MATSRTSRPLPPAEACAPAGRPPEPAAGRLALDRLGGALEVVRLEGAGFAEGPPRQPHRHDYHELVWVRSGEGEHLIDGASVPVRPGTVTLIGRGQVHVFRRAHDLRGAIVRFGDEIVAGSGERVPAGWLPAVLGGRSVAVAPRDGDLLDAAIEALEAEVVRPPDPLTGALERHLLAAILLWVERWYDASRIERRTADDADVQLHRRFAGLLEAEFSRHHDARHYADALAVPQAALSQALVRVAGRGTKELILDRVMVEAKRLLRFTDLSVGQVAHRIGFRDQLYFSRAFKRATGDSPVTYRSRAHGA